MTHHSSAIFLQNIFEKTAPKEDDSHPLQSLICNEHTIECRAFDLSQLQDSWSWRNTHLARELAKMAFDKKGELKKETLSLAIDILEKNLYSLGPGRYQDATRQQHLLRMLRLVSENRDYVYALKQICKPFGQPAVDKLIRETLFLPTATPLNDSHARQAALSALLTSLRQNVGSCFATAPAILIQQDLPLNFLADIAQLFGTGKISRIFDGYEYVVPLSLSWGMGDLFRPITLASLGKNPLKLLSISPGLQAAFVAAGLIEHTKQNTKQKQCEDLILRALKIDPEENPFYISSPDQIIRTVLAATFNVTEEDIARFHEHAFQGPIASPMFFTHSSPRGKEASCNRFQKGYEAARGAFKALTDNALLKAWEFTLASLSESKADFAKWNFYVSLGVQPSEPHGIGESLYAVLQEKITSINQEIEAYQSRYDHLFAQAKYLEGRMRSTDSEKEAGWIQAEYHMRRHEINGAISVRDELYEKGLRLQGFYPFLMNFYGEKIKEYFQEVYDAEMHDVSANPYDDSPAGFRLLYKHGRSNPSTWSLIHSASEYIQHLSAFFVATEIELDRLPQAEGLQREISGLITTALMTIKRPEFLESSFHRLSLAYKEPIVLHPLSHLDKVKRKPWSYISGGTMTTLTSCYWGYSQPPHEVKKWVENENELLAFFIDSFKECTPNIQKKYKNNPNLSMLAFSPTHAFLFKPGWKKFREAWESDTYTYTWIRDQWYIPQLRFLDSCVLNSRMQDVILGELLRFIPEGYRQIARHVLQDRFGALTPPEFRQSIIKALSYEKWLQGGRGLNMIADELDSILYRFLPLFPDHALQETLVELFNAVEGLGDELKHAVVDLSKTVFYQFAKYQMLTAVDLKNIAHALLIKALGITRSPIFYHQKIIEAMQKLTLCYPEPILFADTNWVKNVFGFTTNPGSGQIELWRFDESGDEGKPMSIWKPYLNGTLHKEWGIYISPHQYGL